MAKGFAVCAALCALVHVLSAAVLPEQPQLLTQKEQVRKYFAHLQPEIDEWRRLGHPTTAAFHHKDGVAEIGYLIEMPEKVSLHATNYASNVFFYLFSRENPNGTLVAPNAQAFTLAGFNPKRPTKVVIHGFSNTIESPLFTEMLPGILENTDCNLIGVDWGNLAKAPFYIEARNHATGVGKIVAKLVDALEQDGGLQLEDLHLIGHSLGAHVAGCTGKDLKSKNKIGRITGLDPAMPLYLLLKSDRLNKNDAKLVDVIHTCGGRLGLAEAIGHVDFYPNGGHLPQPGCGLDILGACSHGRSWQFMAESAVEVGAFPASECDTQNDAKNGKCTNKTDGNMGLNLEYNEDGTGKYYLKTASSAPFDLSAHSRAEQS
ncbi:pancreatic triacylglycerol lipase-like [Thrips palmi]|uniref:Pancreatic triacylglycerol lipase-like n=1 Tax=Thrips palmi TaxID=161013 RepID=A0A6P8ZAR8_THRPL|nr:pancreatic triacylglycerol lipase-like [Thrips palmi]